MNIRTTIVLTSLALSLPLVSQSEPTMVFQDCLLEGKVVADRAEDGNNIVRVDFYKAEPFSKEARCIIDGVLKFTQPKGSLIENLSTGSIVQYHYVKTTDGKTTWQLVGAFI